MREDFMNSYLKNSLFMLINGKDMVEPQPPDNLKDINLITPMLPPTSVASPLEARALFGLSKDRTILFDEISNNHPVPVYLAENFVEISSPDYYQAAPEAFFRMNLDQIFFAALYEANSENHKDPYYLKPKDAQEELAKLLLMHEAIMSTTVTHENIQKTMSGSADYVIFHNPKK
ncbi:hypothetical protein F5884DRAFT_849180 [Xylogone sp. PMI_703]|nr:hypothetical protein F5884DRAFT_849180 [Xylogone sp. PMI_703]